VGLTQRRKEEGLPQRARGGTEGMRGSGDECRRVRQNAGVGVNGALGRLNSGEFSYTVVMWVRLRGEGGSCSSLGCLLSFLCVLSASVRDLIAAVLFISQRHGEHGGGMKMRNVGAFGRTLVLGRAERWGGETLASFPTRW
jgi:hypothetical protein